MINKKNLCINDLIVNGSQSDESIAIAVPGRTPLTYQMLRGHIAGIVKTLNSMGYGKNDRFIAVLPNGPEAALAFVSIAAGFTYVPLNPLMSATDYEYAIETIKPVAVIVQKGEDNPIKAIASKHNIPLINLVPTEDGHAGMFSLDGGNKASKTPGGFAGPENIALILSTSGTTSKPKVVPIKHSNLCASALNYINAFELTEKDHILDAMPMYHVQGLCNLLFNTLVAGGKVTCLRRFESKEFLSVIREIKPTCYSAAPAINRQILEQAKAEGMAPGTVKLRFIRSAGAAIPDSLRLELEALFDAPVLDSYGMTESPIITTNPMPPLPRKSNSVGLPQGVEISIISDKGEALKFSDIGEICMKGPSVMGGYDNNPEANASSFINGWFKSGDMGYIDGDGYLFITGRKKELINKGGEKISPYEIEKALATHSAVIDSAAFPIASDTMGEEVCMAVIPASGSQVTPEELRGYLSDRLSFHKVPSYIFLVDEIPKSGPIKKVQRSTLHKSFEKKIKEMKETRAQTATLSREFSNETERQLAGIWAEMLGWQPAANDDFFALGGDSLKVVRVFTAIENTFGVKLSINTIFRAPTIQGMASIIISNQNAMKDGRPGDTIVDVNKDQIIPLNPKGTNAKKLPVFCLNAISGNLMHYQNIISSLSEDRPVYGVQQSDIDGTGGSLEEMAKSCVRAMKTAQPSGPYCLFGHSYAGMLSFEVAKQLINGGDEVKFLGILDQPAEREFWSAKNMFSLQYMTTFCRQSPGLFWHILHQSNERKVKEVKWFFRWCLLVTSIIKEDHPGWIDDTMDGHIRELAVQNFRRLVEYRPQEYKGKITLFSAVSREDIRYLLSMSYPDMGWKKYAKGVDTVYLDCLHNTIIEKPYAKQIAKKIEETIGDDLNQVIKDRPQVEKVASNGT